MGFSYKGDTLILFRLLGFSVNSFDRPPQLGTVGPVAYALNEFSPLSSFVIRCHFLAISWKMVGTQLAFYHLHVSGPVSLIEGDVGYVPGGI